MPPHCAWRTSRSFKPSSFRLAWRYFDHCSRHEHVDSAPVLEVELISALAHVAGTRNRIDVVKRREIWAGVPYAFYPTNIVASLQDASAQLPLQQAWLQFDAFYVYEVGLRPFVQVRCTNKSAGKLCEFR